MARGSQNRRVRSHEPETMASARSEYIKIRREGGIGRRGVETYSSLWNMLVEKRRSSVGPDAVVALFADRTYA